MSAGRPSLLALRKRYVQYAPELRVWYGLTPLEMASLPADERQVLEERLGNFPAPGWTYAVMLADDKQMPPMGFTVLDPRRGD